MATLVLRLHLSDIFEQTLIVKVYDSILMAIFYVNSKSDPNRKVLDD